MSADQLPNPHPPRRQFQFRLRTLLILTALACIVAGLFAARIHESRRQRAIVAGLRGQGARVGMREVQSDVPEWLDTQYLSRVWYVEMNGAPLADASLFAGMRNLEELYLWNTHVSDVAPLTGLKKLKVLDLGGTRVADIRPLVVMQTLEDLAISETAVSDFTPLQELKNLRSVMLYGNQITDLSPLAALEHLEEINLHHTPVSVITPLLQIESLRKLDITYTLVTPESLKQLRAALPACEIRHYRDGDPVIAQ